jgi:hypothetical protein
MNQRKPDPWTRFLKAFIIVASLGVSLCVLVFGAVLFWTEFWHVPRLVYTVLPTYDLKGQSINGLLIENRGRQSAHQVVIRVIELDQPIDVFRIKTNESIASQQADERNIEVSLDRMVPGSFVTLYLPTEHALELEKYLSITAEEGRAVPAASQEEMNSALALAVVGVIILFLMVIGGLIGWVLGRAPGSR